MRALRAAPPLKGARWVKNDVPAALELRAGGTPYHMEAGRAIAKRRAMIKRRAIVERPAAV